MDIRPPKSWRSKIPPPVSKTEPVVEQPASTLENSQITPVNIAPAPVSQAAKPKLSKKSRLIMIISGVIIAVLISLIFWCSWLLSPRDASASTRTVNIVSGSSPSTIGDQLESKGLIRSSSVFQFYVTLTGNSQKLQAGRYKLSANMSVGDIVGHLVKGENDIFMITILPGMTLKQLADPNIKNSLVDQGFSREEVERAYKASYKSPLLGTKPTGATLEGYIFPETYQLGMNDTLESLFERTFSEFYERLQKSGALEKIATKNLTLHQALTLASIVQKEVPDKATQKRVAQVFERRLSIGMALGADPTFRYAAELDGQAPSVNYDSPYNTRLYAGLPPGPIANMELSAVEAVAEPANEDYLYFVSGDDGQTHFSKTEAEHIELTRRYCTALCQ